MRATLVWFGCWGQKSLLGSKKKDGGCGSNSPSTTTPPLKVPAKVAEKKEKEPAKKTEQSESKEPTGWRNPELED